MTTWTKRIALATSYINRTVLRLAHYLLKEDSFYLLLEDGGKIVIHDASFVDRTPVTTQFTNRTPIA